MVGLIFGILVLIGGLIGGVAIICHDYKGAGFGVMAGSVFLCILLIFLGCICSVDTGNTGIVTTFGRVENYTLEAGFHTKAPWNSIVQMDNRVQKTTITLPCFSSDIQEVNTIYTVNYQINKANAQELYKTVGTDYLNTVIQPAITESVKTIMAHYTAEELIGKRNTLAAEVEEYLSEQLVKYNIEVVSTAIEDMDFTDSFTNAVEAKQVAAQTKLKAEIEQGQQKLQAAADAEVAKTKAAAEAEVAKTKANADAEIAKIQANAEMEVVKIQADAAEYQGRKEAAIKLQAFASINGWTVVIDANTGSGKVVKSDGTEPTEDELKLGTQRLIEYYYTQTWNGQLPTTYVGEDGVNSILIGQ